MDEEESAAVGPDDNEIIAGMLSTSAVIVTGKVEIYTIVLSSMGERVILSRGQH